MHRRINSFPSLADGDDAPLASISTVASPQRRKRSSSRSRNNRGGNGANDDANSEHSENSSSDGVGRNNNKNDNNNKQLVALSGKNSPFGNMGKDMSSMVKIYGAPDVKTLALRLANSQRYLENCQRYDLHADPGVVIALNTGWNILQPTKRFGEGGLLPLIDVLGSIDHVKKLRMKGSSMTEPKYRDSGNGNSNARALQYILQSNKSIEYLDLSDTGLDDDGVLEVCEGLKKNKTVTDVNLSYNHFGEVGAKLLKEALDNNASIKKLDVSRNGLDFNSINTLVMCCTPRGTRIETQGNFVFEEILNSVSHGIGFFLALIGGQVLVSAAAEQELEDFQYWSCVVFSFALIFLFLSSTLFHAFFMSPLASRVLQICDHIGIYMVIAGSYTPILIVALRNSPRAKILLAFEWIGFFFGTLFTAFADLSGNFVTQAVELTCFLSMGAGFLTVWDEFTSQLPKGFIILCFMSCFTYVVGIVFFIMGDKKHPIYHSVWHLHVLFAATFHWFGIYLFVVKKDLGVYVTETAEAYLYGGHQFNNNSSMI